MGNLMNEQSNPGPSNAAMPAARRVSAMPSRPAAIVRRVASVQAAVYDWASGPPITALEREQALMADIRNYRRTGTLLI